MRLFTMNFMLNYMYGLGVMSVLFSVKATLYALPVLLSVFVLYFMFHHLYALDVMAVLSVFYVSCVNTVLLSMFVLTVFLG